MPSPFPGMDPWLERPAVFPDLRFTFTVYLSRAINAVVPEPYYSIIRERTWLETYPRRIVEPDAVVPPPARTGDVVTVHAPIGFSEFRENYLEIRDSEPGDGRPALTTIEVLSIENKTPDAESRGFFRQRQREDLSAGVNRVEIDLLRRGRHTTAVPFDWAVEKTGRFDYHVCVHRFDRPEDFEVYPVRLPESLPSVSLPLLPGTPDVVVNLQDLLTQCYDTGLYGRRVRYHEHQPEPPLTDEQARWAEDVLRARGLIRGTAPQ